MTDRPFPQITPSSRSFRPGKPPETMFQSQNGSTVLVQFGGKFVDSQLELEFRNISDQQAQTILEHYESVVGEDYVVFNKYRGLGGMAKTLRESIQKGDDLLRYRYKEPPSLQSVYPGVSTIRCSFVGLLYGA